MNFPRSFAIALSFISILLCASARAQIDGGGDSPPDILGISPTSGPAGTQITVSGMHFQTYGSARIGFVGAPFTYVSPFQIVVTVPANATSARVIYETLSGTTASPEMFIVTTSSAPSITGFSPASGRAGDQITITGSSFSSGAHATFAGGVAATTYLNSETSLTAIVPAGAASGPITVTTSNGSATSSQSFSITTPTPTITSFSPQAAHAGDLVSVNGTALDGVSSVTFNGAMASFHLVGGIQIQATVPVTATTGPIRVSSPAGSAASTTFIVLTGYGPVITSFSPASGRAGTVVDINGGNLDRINNAGFGGWAASALTLVSPSLARATVPAGAVSGPITVNGPDGSASSSASFQLLLDPPTITGFTPPSARPGEAVTINGTNFDGTARAAFNGVTATTTVVSSTVLSAIVPAAGSTGPIRVTTASGSATGAEIFTVLPSLLPTITSFSPTSAAPGATITLNGANLGTTRFVSFNGVIATFRYTGSSISATVPLSASSGKIVLRNAYGETQSATSFFVKAIKPSTVILTKLAGKVLLPGTKVSIGWYTEPVEGVEIASNTLELSTNFGETYGKIVDLPGTATSYGWTVPALPTAGGVLRLIVRDQTLATGTDITDGYFIIGGAIPEDSRRDIQTFTAKPGEPVMYDDGIQCKVQPDCFTMNLVNVNNAPLFGAFFSTGANDCSKPGQVKSCGPRDTFPCGAFRFTVTTDPKINEGDYQFNVQASAGTSYCTSPNLDFSKFIIHVVRPTVTLKLDNPALSLTAGDVVTQTVRVTRKNYDGPLKFELVSDPSDTDGFYGGNIALNADNLTITVTTFAPAEGQTPTRAGKSKFFLRAYGDFGVFAELPFTVDVTIKPTLILLVGKQKDPVMPSGTATYNVRVLRYNFDRSNAINLQVDCSAIANCTSDPGTEEIFDDLAEGLRSVWKLKIFVPIDTLPKTYGFTVTATHQRSDVDQPSKPGTVVVQPLPKSLEVRPMNSLVQIAAPGCTKLPFQLLAHGFDADVTATVKITGLTQDGIVVQTTPPTSYVIPVSATDGVPGTASISVASNVPRGAGYTFFIEATEGGGVQGSAPVSLSVLNEIPVNVSSVIDKQEQTVFAGRPIGIDVTVNMFTGLDCPPFNLPFFMQFSKSGNLQPLPDQSGPYSADQTVHFSVDTTSSSAQAIPYEFALTATTQDGRPMQLSSSVARVTVTDRPFIEIAQPKNLESVPGGSKLTVQWTTNALMVTAHKISVGGVTRDADGMATSATFILPNPSSDENMIVRVEAFDPQGSLASSSVTITVTPSPNPAITAFDPPSEYPGFTFAVLGDGFVEGTRVRIGAIEQSGFTLSGKTIGNLKVPVVDPSGQVEVEVQIISPREFETSRLFPVLTHPPRITMVVPNSATVGDPISIGGDGFVKDSRTEVIFAGNVRATDVTVKNHNELSVKVPPGALFGKVKVITLYGEATSSEDFTPANQ